MQILVSETQILERQKDGGMDKHISPLVPLCPLQGLFRVREPLTLGLLFHLCLILFPPASSFYQLYSYSFLVFYSFHLSLFCNLCLFLFVFSFFRSSILNFVPLYVKKAAGESKEEFLFRLKLSTYFS